MAKAETDFIMRKINEVKAFGYGTVEFKIQDAQVVYANIQIGEQLKLNI